jgi:hypothetical protein
VPGGSGPFGRLREPTLPDRFATNLEHDFRHRQH